MRPPASFLPAALAALAVALGAAPGGARPDGVRFDASARDRLVLSTSSYRLTLAKRTGKVLSLVDPSTGAQLVDGENGCLWGAVLDGDPSYLGGCSYAPRGASRFTYRWSPRGSTLTLAYRSDPGARRRIDVVVGVTAAPSWLDLRLTLENHTGGTLRSVTFPADLAAPVAGVQAGYAPKFLPGVRLSPGFFSRVGSDITTYPSRWAFADYLAFDAGGGHLALSAVNPSPAPLAPVDLGFTHTAAPGACSGPTFCIVHGFDTWIADGATWTTPTVRIRLGESVEQSIAGYRADNGIDAYPSLADKVGARLPTLARAPLLKADLWKGLRPFKEWMSDLERLPSPMLLHPVAFTLHGHDENDPDFLPPDPIWGTTADFAGMVAEAHSLGSLVMPYLNVSWWNVNSPTVRNLPSPLTPKDIAVLDEQGNPVIDHYNGHVGYTVSPYVPFVRSRAASLIQQFGTEVPADCLFFDQVGARPWRRDLNPAEPSPLSYYDGWLALFAPYADRCVMSEDGWDRLAQTFSGFLGSVASIAPLDETPDDMWGAGNWQPYPLADWLLHDKVLLYQHDLYDGSMVTDIGALSFDVTFGFQLSYEWSGWDKTLDSPWLPLVGAFQSALGPHYAGQPLSSWRDVAPGVSESVFGDLTVTSNLDGTAAYDAGGYGLPAQGFLARTADGTLVAGAFAGSFDGYPLSPGTHYLVVERSADTVTVRQPVGASTTVAVDPPTGWTAGRPPTAQAYDDAGAPHGGPIAVSVQGGKLVFDCPGTAGGEQDLTVRISVG